MSQSSVRPSNLAISSRRLPRRRPQALLGAMHIGLIGGIGPAATDYYHRGLIALAAAAGRPLELTIAHADAATLVRNLAAGDAAAQAAIFARLIDRLRGAGAELAAVTSMGGHFCAAALAARTSLPLVDALPALDDAIAARGLKTVGVIGTRTVMETRCYGRVHAAAIVIPEGAALDAVHQAYIGMAVPGRATDAQREVCFAAGQSLCRDRGADSVILGGTDLFLAFDGHDCGFAVLDAAQVHIAAIHRASLGA